MVNQNKLGNEEKDTCEVQTKYNEVSIVDKYEYKLKTEQMLKLMETVHTTEPLRLLTALIGSVSEI